MAERCPRCDDRAIEYDPSGACFVCQTCGFVPREQSLVTQEEAAQAQGGTEAQQQGAAAAYGGPAGAAAEYAATTKRARYADEAGPSGSGAAPRAARRRGEVDELEVLAGVLRLPRGVAQAAGGFLARLHAAADDQRKQRAAAREAAAEAEAASELLELQAGSGPVSSAAPASDAAASDAAASSLRFDGLGADSEGDEELAEDECKDGDEGAAAAGAAAPAPARRRCVPVTGGAGGRARLGCLLWLAARCEGAALSLAEVAAATQTDMYRLGEVARQYASFLGLALPPTDVERFVGRMAADMALQLAAEGGRGAGEEGGEGTEWGGGGRGAVLSAAQLAAHPLVARSRALAGLAVRRGWHEGRTPRTVAGAVLSLVADSLAASGVEGLPPLRPARLAAHAMCSPGQLAEHKHQLVALLLRLAAPLPFAPLLRPGNLPAHLEVVLAAERAGLAGGEGGTGDEGDAGENVPAEAEGPTDDTLPLRIAAIFIILTTGLIGGLPPLFLKIFRDPTSAVTQLVRSFAAGVILALALVHIIPEAVTEMEGLGGIEYPIGGVCVLFGVVLMVLLEHLAHLMHGDGGDGHKHGAARALRPDAADSGWSEGASPLKAVSSLKVIPAVGDVEADPTPGAGACKGDHAHSHHAGAVAEAASEHTHVCVSRGPASNWLSSAASDVIGTARDQIVAMLFELGCIFHSFIIGLSLGVNQTDLTEVRSLLIALAFHQWLEGISLSSVIIRGGFSRLKGCGMVVLYSLTCPIGIAIGIAIASSYDGESERARGIQGAFNGVSGGMLLYISLVQLVAEDMSLMLPGRNSALIRMGCSLALALGAASMCILAIWA
ncbi:hypothetical protein HYH03_006631 [Edaphochlamys debaryana]|uniref:Uncharacterized protein n=1 Tax=Edaphochlamys debaryana TaxID=47281 RepID=A0A835Y3Q9_9CHLO|nr:hypothetical protein HYH03_006631 [Edaphochlamys debaryana]|eukprot:KAG2495363.1 hypothetical protein HYH03_006631 [Edaphochlamys debaryana]